MRPELRSIYLRMCRVNSEDGILHGIYVVLPSFALVFDLDGSRQLFVEHAAAEYA